MTEKEHGFNILRISGVFCLDQIFNFPGGICAIDVETRHGPSVADEIELQTMQFTGEVLRMGVVHDEQKLSASVGHWYLNAGINVAVARIGRRFLHDLIFVGGAKGDVAIDEGCVRSRES